MIRKVNLPNEYSVRQLSGRPGFNPKSSYAKPSKMVIGAALLNTQYYKVRIKRSNPGNSVAPTPAPRCGSY